MCQAACTSAACKETGCLRMFFSSLWWVALAVALFWAVGAHNRLVRLRSAAAQAFGALDAHLAQLLALLATYEAAQSSAGAPPAVQRDALQAAAAQCAEALAGARAHPLRTAAVAPLSQSLQSVEAAWADVTQQLPTLAAPAGTEPWLLRWEQHHARTLQARRKLAGGRVVLRYGSGKVGARLLAWLMGFRPAHPV